MEPLIWTEAFSTGDVTLDEQHKTLVQAFNALCESVDQKRGREAVGKTLLFLVAYSAQHFQAEERLMAETNYPDAKRHKELHHDLVIKISLFMKNYAAGSVNLTVEVLSFVEGWLVEHMLGEDLLFARHLKAGSSGIEH